MTDCIEHSNIHVVHKAVDVRKKLCLCQLVSCQCQTNIVQYDSCIHVYDT